MLSYGEVSGIHRTESIRLWVSNKLKDLAGKIHLPAAELQGRIDRLNTKRDALLAEERKRAWATRRLCLDKSLQLQSYGTAATLKLRKPAEVGGKHADESMPWHKAVALSLVDKRMPVLKCMTQPFEALRLARGGVDEVAQRRQEELFQEAAAARFKLRLPERDRNGRLLLVPSSSARTAREVGVGVGVGVG